MSSAGTRWRRSGRSTAEENRPDSGPIRAGNLTTPFMQGSAAKRDHAFQGEGTEFKRSRLMKKIAKLALGALMLAGTAATVGTTPANAGVSVGIGVGVPGPYYGYGPGWCRWHPYRCAGYDPYYYDDAYYNGPVFIDGVWFNGPLRWRWWGGARQFWWHGGWRVGTGWHAGGFHGGGFRGPTVANHFGGGHFSGGHFGGHGPT